MEPRRSRNKPVAHQGKEHLVTDRIGQFDTVTVWAMYFVPESDPGRHANLGYQLPGERLPVVVGLVAEDDSGNACKHCFRCVYCVNAGHTGECPGMAAHAQVEWRREQERRPEVLVELAQLDVPAYLGLAGRIREVVVRLAQLYANPARRDNE
jgi:hypothetical protein